ncbi:MAG: MFS transporter [Pirellulaceae bacterium]|nr:MFS transporter [Pirellulaceae bacterium]
MPAPDDPYFPVAGQPIPSHASAPDPAVYDWTFWFCYAANCSLMMGVSLLFRYADFVSYLGGSEMDLGLIVGVGMLGALATRVFQGIGIDRLGPRRIWIMSLCLFATSVLAHLAVSRVNGPGVYLARILLTTSIAGAFGSSLTYVTLRAPHSRMAETIGVIGTSGFIGLALGPTLGDLFLAGDNITRPQIVRLFVASASLSLVALFFVLRTDNPSRRLQRRYVPIAAVLWRYHPGLILLVAAATGIILGLPNTFLNAYANELGIPRIKIFFLVYALTALAVRIRFRHLVDRWGVRPGIQWGLSAAVLSVLSYLLVRNEWSLALPAVFAGTAHALLFPAVVAGGNASFPTRYRGIATTLMLAMFDIGNLIGQPLMGGVIELARRMKLPPYPVLFFAVTVGLLIVGSIYCCSASEGSKKPRKKPVAAP